MVTAAKARKLFTDSLTIENLVLEHSAGLRVKILPQNDIF